MSKSQAVTTYEALSNLLGYTFKNQNWLKIAFTHKSFGNEHLKMLPLEERDNERLEFLGDAVLELLISKILLDQFPEFSEGELSKKRASIVNEKSLAGIARYLKLGDYLHLGKGEDTTGGRDKDSILASTLEALIAAIFKDSDYETTEKTVAPLFNLERGLVDQVQDFKTRLQEITQAMFKDAPHYELVSTSGPDHEKIFEVAVSVNNKVLTSATGKSKKEAEQKAAENVFLKFGRNLEKI